MADEITAEEIAAGEAVELSPDEYNWDISTLTNAAESDEIFEEQFSLLRLWSEVLSNIESAAEERIPMGVAWKIVRSWPQVTFQNTQAYHTLFHEILLSMRAELERVISEHPGAVDLPESRDMEENYPLYKELVVNWNIMLDMMETEWVATDEDSEVQFAVIVDVRAFLFGQDGFAGHLDARGFQLSTDEIRDAILAARGDQ